MFNYGCQQVIVSNITTRKVVDKNKMRNYKHSEIGGYNTQPFVIAN